MVAPTRQPDTRDQVEAAVNQQYLIFSLVQVRLFGLLLLLFLGFKLALSLLLLIDSDPCIAS